MAKTAYSIQMDFQKAKKQAEKLERIAKDLNRIANNDMPSCMRNLSSGWRGETARRYIGKGETVEEKLRSVARNLTQTASVIRTIAKNTYNAEKTALDVAKKRRY